MNTSTIGIKQLGGKAVRLVSKAFEASVTIDPASLATVTGAVTADITVTGAAVGDAVRVFPPYNTQGIIVYGYVSAANTVKLSMFNPTGSTIDLASGTWTVQAIRR